MLETGTTEDTARFTREELLEWGRQRASEGKRLDPASTHFKRKDINRYWDDYYHYLKELGDDIYHDYFYLGKYRKGKGPNKLPSVTKWDSDNLITWGKTRVKEGKPLNYTVIEKENSNFIWSINREFGSHAIYLKQLEDKIGSFDLYGKGSSRNNYIRDKSLYSARLGHEFEEVVGEIFDYLGVEYSKYLTDTENCEPDFILEGNIWVDAKISINTSTGRMRKKYLPHCSKLYTVTLIGKEGYTGTLADGTERVNVFAMTALLPPRERSEVETHLREMVKEYQRPQPLETTSHLFERDIPLEALRLSYLRGDTVKTLCERYGTTEETINRRLTHLGISSEDRYPDWLINWDEITLSYAQGMGMAKIAEVYRLPLILVRDHLRDYPRLVARTPLLPLLEIEKELEKGVLITHIEREHSVDIRTIRKRLGVIGVEGY